MVTFVAPPAHVVVVLVPGRDAVVPARHPVRPNPPMFDTGFHGC